MDKRGEVEVRLNKRWIERAFFLLVIIGLVVLYFMKAAPDTGELENSVSSLEQQVSEKDGLIQQLHQQIESLNKTTNKTQTIIIIQNTTPSQTTPPPAPAIPTIAGTPTIDWVLDAIVMKAIDYNAAEIKSLQGNLTILEDEYENASGTSASDLKDQIDETKASINILKFGPAKVSLRNITLIIDNSNFTATTVAYEVCWLTLDCSVVKSSGSIKVAAGAKLNSTLILTIPALLALDKTQTLSISVTQGINTVLSDSQSFNRVTTTT